MLGMRKKGLEFKNFTVMIYKITGTGAQPVSTELLSEVSLKTLSDLGHTIAIYLLKDKTGSFSSAEVMSLPADCAQNASLSPPPTRAPA